MSNPDRCPKCGAWWKSHMPNTFPKCPKCGHVHQEPATDLAEFAVAQGVQTPEELAAFQQSVKASERKTCCNK